MTLELQGAWYTYGLPGIECTGATYCRRALADVPSIEAPTPLWSWVPRVPHPLEWSIDGASEGQERAFLDAVATARLQLPDSFIEFVTRRELRDAIRSGTGCWWTLGPDSLATLPADPTPTIRFLNDQQDVLFWYLLLDGSPDPPVVVSYQDFGDPTVEPGPPDDVWKCASTFHEFMYRFWIENEVSFRSEAGERLTPEQAVYLAEAKRLNAGGAGLR
jgi:hypothetical protein